MKKFLLTLLGCITFGGCANAPAKLTVPANAVLLDVRSAAEFEAGHISGAVNIPHDRISEKIAAVAPEKSTPLYIYCRSGRRVKIAIEALSKLGYSELHDLGGMDDAKKVLDTP